MSVAGMSATAYSKNRYKQSALITARDTELTHLYRNVVSRLDVRDSICLLVVSGYGF